KDNLLDNSQVCVSFQPVYQCLHIFDTLGIKNEFQNLFEENRRIQANLTLTQNVKLDEDLAHFEFFLREVVGFFIVEFYLLHSPHAFRSKLKIESLWENAMSKINSIVSENFRDCKNPQIFLSLKKMNYNVIKTMRGYNFNTQPMEDFQLILFNRYLDTIRSQMNEQILKSIEGDDFELFHCPNKDTFSILKSELEFIQEPGEYPSDLPFTKSVYDLFLRIKEFIFNFYLFFDDNEFESGDIDDIVKKHVDNFLNGIIATKYLEKVTSEDLKLISQVCLNFEAFIYLCSGISKILLEKRNFKVSNIILTAEQTFKDSKKSVEFKLFEMVNNKIESLIQQSGSPSSYISKKEKAFIYFEALTHLSNSILNILVGPTPPKLSYQFIENLNIDLTLLESFIKKLKDANLDDVFIEIRQILQLIRNNKFDDYLDSNIRNKRFSMLKSSN
ncbi:hypothetical protein ROZALSC1DRAFT_30318, partial [Rozella allomycis CSF55]